MKTTSTTILFCCIAIVVVSLAGQESRADVVTNEAYRLTAKVTGNNVHIRVDDLVSDTRLADGLCLYHATIGHGENQITADHLENPTITVEGTTLIVRGKLLGLDVEHRFTAPKGRPILDERIIVKNNTNGRIALSDFEVGMQRRVAAPRGKLLAEVAQDRLLAVPFLHRASDPKGSQRDFSMQDVVTKPGAEPHVLPEWRYREIPSRHRVSESWAWAHGPYVTAISKFCQEHLQFSVVSTHRDKDGVWLRFGGAAMIDEEPADLGRLGPGQSVDLGLVRFETLRGGHREACYAFRALLDEMGCRFPKDFNPPVHWNQLYDMWGAWNDRPNRYTKEIVEREAAKAKAFSCEALYLDPGWDTTFGSFLWGEQWLGPRRAFIEQMQSKYGLKVSLHAPLATWVSSRSPMGKKDAYKSYPPESYRVVPRKPVDDSQMVPALHNNRRNLALLPGAKAAASSVYADGRHASHAIDHLNDGWYGNHASWISGTLPAWVEVDLGSIHTISEICLGNDHTDGFKDRAATKLRILAATKYDPSSSAATWREIARHKRDKLLKSEKFNFAPIEARWVRVEILDVAKKGQMPRLDEIEVYEAAAATAKEAKQFQTEARRGPRPIVPWGQSIVCLSSKQYLDTAAERLLANCADGVVYLMFDGNMWNDGCNNPNHGHPVPLCKEDHIRANLELARRIHAKYPNVLIEMHDMIAGCSKFRYTPVYYKYGLPGSFDMNWGFELMWNPMADIVRGRTEVLYYANLGSNVPFYTHVNLSYDNIHCIIVWWYASTCRHFGIGGLHKDPEIVKAQQKAMRWYRAHEAFYKRGEFYGMNKEIHLHVLPRENAFTVNAFNLTDKTRKISGQIDLKSLGLDPSLKYVSPEAVGTITDGRYHVNVELPPWGTKVGAFKSSP